jgi:hypothetical protein
MVCRFSCRFTQRPFIFHFPGALLVSREGRRLDLIIIHTFRRCVLFTENDLLRKSCVSPSRGDSPLAMQDNPKLAAQMSCISAKSAQQLHPLDPVALGVVPLGDQDGIQQWTHEQAQWHMYHQYYQQQQAFMAQMMATQPPPPVSGDHATDASTETKTDESKTNDSAVSVSGTSAVRAPVPPFGPQQMAAMQAFYHQQQQYYAQAMAHQQHLMQNPPAPPIPTATVTAAVTDGSTERVHGSTEQSSMGPTATNQVVPLKTSTEPASQPIANNGVSQEAAPTTNLVGVVEEEVNNANATTAGHLHELSAHSAAGNGLEMSNLEPVVQHDSTTTVLHPTSNLLPDLSSAVAAGTTEEATDRRAELAAEDTMYV